MHLIKVGRRRLNIDYLIMDEEWDGTDDTQNIPTGGAQVTMKHGLTFTLNAADAEVYRRQIALLVTPDCGPELPGAPSRTTDVEPKSGTVTNPKKRVRK